LVFEEGNVLADLIDEVCEVLDEVAAILDVALGGGGE